MSPAQTKLRTLRDRQSTERGRMAQIAQVDELTDELITDLGAAAQLGRSDPSQLLVVYDDFALQLGTIRIRPVGSAGGHNGMESVLEIVSSAEIPRLRIGISQGEPPSDCSSYFLDDFEKKEVEVLEEVLNRCSQAIDTILSDGVERAMSLYN